MIGAFDGLPLNLVLPLTSKSSDEHPYPRGSHMSPSEILKAVHQRKLLVSSFKFHNLHRLKNCRVALVAGGDFFETRSLGEELFSAIPV